jgi:hypothetical protein
MRLSGIPVAERPVPPPGDLVSSHQELPEQSLRPAKHHRAERVAQEVERLQLGVAYPGLGLVRAQNQTLPVLAIAFVYVLPLVMLRYAVSAVMVISEGYGWVQVLAAVALLSVGM